MYNKKYLILIFLVLIIASFFYILKNEYFQNDVSDNTLPSQINDISDNIQTQYNNDTIIGNPVITNISNNQTTLPFNTSYDESSWTDIMKDLYRQFIHILFNQ